MQWYKYRYAILSGSGGTVRESDWRYMWVPDEVIKDGREEVRNYIEINGCFNCEYARLEFKKTSKVPLDILEEEHRKYTNKALRFQLIANEISEVIEDVEKRNANKGR